MKESSADGGSSFDMYVAYNVDSRSSDDNKAAAWYGNSNRCESIELSTLFQYIKSYESEMRQ